MLPSIDDHERGVMTKLIITTANPILVEAVRHALRPTQFYWLFAENVQKTIQTLQSDELPDLLLLDLSAYRALDFLKQMKTSTKFAEIPVLVVVDDPDSVLIKEALAAGAARWLTTGFVRTSLATVVNQIAAEKSGNR